MAFIKWSKDLSVGVGTFDIHHMRLVDMINELHDAMLVGKANSLIGKTLKGLYDYTKYHFAEEERLMAAHNFPGYADHKAQHDRFVEKIRECLEKHESGAFAITIDLMNFLREWLTGHIMKTDKNYSVFFETRKVA